MDIMIKENLIIETRKIIDEAIIEKDKQRNIDETGLYGDEYDGWGNMIKGENTRNWRESYFGLKRNAYTLETIKNYIKTHECYETHQHQISGIVWERIGKHISIVKQHNKRKIYVFLDGEYILTTNYKEISNILRKKIYTLYEICFYDKQYIEYISSNHKNMLREKKLKRLFNYEN